MHDLFISYKSDDVLWAERLYRDLMREFPSLDIFWDRSNLQLGQTYRDQLRDGTIQTRYLVALWSEKSRASDEVRYEVAAFETATQRLHLPMPLQGTYTPADATQGLVGVAKLKMYDASLADLGTGTLDKPGPDQREWDYMIRKLGDTLMDTITNTDEILLAVLAMPKEWLPDLQVKTRLGDMYRPEYYLQEIGLNWADLETRYGASAFEWQPFGDGATVIELLEALRVRANRGLPGRGFHWRPIDMMNKFVTLSDETELTTLLEQLNSQASVVVVDPISLYHRDVQTVFLKLDKYITRESSTVVSFSPVHRRGVTVLYQALRQRTKPLLEQYFEPDIPPGPGAFAHCGLNLDSVSELERLVRYRLGVLEAQRRRTAASQATGLGT